MAKTYLPMLTILARHICRIITKHSATIYAAIDASSLTTEQKATLKDDLTRIQAACTLLALVSGY